MACIREMQEETRLLVTSLQLIGVYSDPKRDPRRHTVSVAFLATADLSTLRSGSDAMEVILEKNWKNTILAFDHMEIVKDAASLFEANAS